MDRDAGKLQHENIRDHERIRDRDAKDKDKEKRFLFNWKK